MPTEESKPIITLARYYIITTKIRKHVNLSHLLPIKSSQQTFRNFQKVEITYDFEIL